MQLRTFHNLRHFASDSIKHQTIKHLIQGALLINCVTIASAAVYFTIGLRKQKGIKRSLCMPTEHTNK
jgi:hypothetical protein